MSLASMLDDFVSFRVASKMKTITSFPYIVKSF